MESRRGGARVSLISAISARLLAAIIAATIALNPLLFIRLHSLPQAGKPSTVAAATRTSAASNYFSHALEIAAIVMLAAVLAWCLRAWAARLPAEDKLRRVAIVTIAGILALFLPYHVPNPTFTSIYAPILDEFHEGEVLGLAPYLHASAELPKPILIHGPGMDLATAWAGVLIAPRVAGIAAIRLIYRCLGSGTVVVLFWTLFVVYREREEFLAISEPAAGVLRYWTIGAWIAIVALVGQITARRLFLWPQIALMLLAARGLRQEPRRSLYALFALIGGLAPISILYNYGFGLSGTAATVLGLNLLGWRYRGRALRPLLASVFSAAVVAAVLWAVPGPTSLAAAWRDMRYWSGNAFASVFLPVHVDVIGSTALLLVMATSCVLVFSMVLAFRNFLRTASTRQTSGFDEVFALALFLSAALFEFRPYLERADLQNLQYIVPSFLLIALYALMPLVSPPAAAIIESIPEHRYGALKWTAVVLFGFIALQGLNPLAELYVMGGGAVSPAKLADTSIVGGDENKIVQEMGAEIKAQPCFYALSHSSVWYYLFDRPSCSTFYEPAYARSAAAQREVIADLRRYRPRIVLAVDGKSPVLDGFTAQDTCPDVWAYLQAAYVPYKTLNGREFYRLRDAGLR